LYSKGEIKGVWIKLPDEELHDLSPSQNIIRVIKTGRMKWAGHVTSMDDKRYA
jgi:hypothetical protein